jgi:hypothetical protein
VNKLTTQSYFIKRLKDSGYEVWKVFDQYSDADSRYWTIVIDPGVASVFCTCFVDDERWDHSYFELSDGGRFIPRGYKIDTDSIEVFITHLVKFGINNKRTDIRK